MAQPLFHKYQRVWIQATPEQLNTIGVDTQGMHALFCLKPRMVWDILVDKVTNTKGFGGQYIYHINNFFIPESLVKSIIELQ